MERLAGKVVLVTGGGSGIGLSVAKAFLQEGAKVAISGRDEAKLRRAAAELGCQDRLTYCRADVADLEDVRKLVNHVRSLWERVDILVNNAGVNLKKRAFRELTPESWQLLLRANLDGAFHCIYAVLPLMLERREGLIINISSIAGKRANPLGGAAYVASKFGMTGLGMCLATEEKDNGIRVSNIYPGEVDTPLLDNRPVPVGPDQRLLILQPEDVAAAALFVATLHPRASVPELVIKPTTHVYI